MPFLCTEHHDGHQLWWQMQFVSRTMRLIYHVEFELGRVWYLALLYYKGLP